MKKILFITVFFVCSIAQVHAEPQYVVIRLRSYWRVEMKHVDKPKKLRKWYYDKPTDTYFRIKGPLWGVRIW